MKHMLRIAFALVCLTLIGRSASAEDWPQWRGPAFNGSTTESGLPTAWSKTENVAWVTPLPGLSGATPIVFGDRVFVTSVDAQYNDLLAICLDRTDGKVLWKKKTGKDRSVARNNMASPSPVTDGKSVFFYYGTGGLIAFDYEGKKLWEREIEKDHGPFSIMFGYSSSPLLFRGKLYIPVIQNKSANAYRQTGWKQPLDSYLLAIDPQTGKDLWKQVRRTDAVGEAQEAYTTPIPYEGPGRRSILLTGADYFTVHDPDTGVETWRWGAWNPRKINHWRIVPSVVTAPGIALIGAPKHNTFFALRLDDPEAKDPVAWTLPRPTPDASTPLYYGGRFYILDDDARVMICVDAKTGEKKWQGSLGGDQVFRASPTGADGKIYCVNEGGRVVVLAAGDEFKILGEVTMGEGFVRSSIVAAYGKLFIRTARNLYCIGAGR